MRPALRIPAPMLCVLAAVVLVAAGCTSRKPPVATTPSRPAPAPVGPQTFSVSVDATSAALPIAADEYFPDTIQVHPGDTLKFDEVWSGEPHTVTFGTLVDQADPTSTALPSIFPRAGRSGDANPVAAQPCFLGTGTLPTTGPCPVVSQPPLSGLEPFYNSGWLPPTSTFTVPLSPTINPGTYTFRCLVHPDMTGRIQVVPPAQTIPSPADVSSAGTAQVTAVVQALAPVAEDAAAVTTTNVAGITAGSGVTTTLVTTFGPPELDVGVSQTVNFNVYGTHALAINPPDSAFGLLTMAADGTVHINSQLTTNRGGEQPPSGLQTRSRVVFGGSFPGGGFHDSGLLTSYPPGLLTYSLQFIAPGTFTLRCLVHPAMTTTVKVSP